MSGIVLGEDVAFATSRSVAPLSTEIEAGLSSFWKSLSSAGKSFFSGPGGKVVKVGAQVGSAVALPAAAIGELNTQTAPEQKAITNLTGSPALGTLFPVMILAAIAIIFLIVLFK